MLYHLSSIEFDPLGVVAVRPLADMTDGETRRRINRIQTLDGGVVFNDSGYTESDRTIVLRWRTRGHAQEVLIERLAMLYAFVTLSCRRGVYIVGIEKYEPGAIESSMTLLVKQKLSEDA